MSIEKLNLRLQNALLKSGWPSLTPLQEQLLPAYKSGSDLVVNAADSLGKTSSIAIHTLEKIKEQAPDDAPRAIIMTTTIDEAAQLEILFKKLAFETDLRIFLMHDKANSILQRNDLFDGCDIMIGNVTRINKLYLQNGFSVKHVKLLVLDNLEELIGFSNNPNLLRLVESMPKAQKVVYFNKMTPRTENFIEEWLIKPLLIEQ